MLPTGHEGPYSLESLISRKSSLGGKVWAEGLEEAVPLRVAIEKSTLVQKKIIDEIDEDEIPPLPPMVQVKNQTTSPKEEPLTDFHEEISLPTSKTKRWIGLSLGILIIGCLLVRSWVSSKEEFSFTRANRMSPNLFQKISSDFKFEGWDRKIFLKEYVPSDMSHIWLATSGFQSCEIQASFNSIKGKLLAAQDEDISFKSSAILKNHIAEFSRFDFTSGNKIVPGLYEMDLQAKNCSWGGLAAKFGNLFRSPDDHYMTRMKVVLFHKGNIEFNLLLDKLIKRKMDLELKSQNQEELFWQELQQKLQTLLAISLQIEQLFLEFAESPVSHFPKSLKLMVDKYTRNYGHFLTEFLSANEKYFVELEKSEILNIDQKRPYEGIIKLTSKNIGFESMKLIEEFQKMKKPTKKVMEITAIKIKKKFEILKDGVNSKIIQITEDRSR